MYISKSKMISEREHKGWRKKQIELIRRVLPSTNEGKLFFPGVDIKNQYLKDIRLIVSTLRSTPRPTNASEHIPCFWGRSWIETERPSNKMIISLLYVLLSLRKGILKFSLFFRVGEEGQFAISPISDRLVTFYGGQTQTIVSNDPEKSI